MSDVKVTIDLTGTETPRFRGGRTLDEIRAEAAKKKQEAAEAKAKKDAAKKQKEADDAAIKAKKEEDKLIKDTQKAWEKEEKAEKSAREKYNRELSQAQNAELSARDAALGKMASTFGFGEVFSFMRQIERVQATTKRVEQIAALGKATETAATRGLGVDKKDLKDGPKSTIQTIRELLSGGGGGGGGGGGKGLLGFLGGGGKKGGLFSETFFNNITIGLLAFDALTNIVGKVVRMFAALDQALDSHMRTLGQYGGAISMAQATRDINRIENEIRQSRALSGPGSEYVMAQTRSDTAFFEAQTEILKQLLPLGTAIRDEVTDHLKMITSIFELLNAMKVPDMIRYMAIIAEWIDSTNPLSYKFYFKLYETIKNAILGAEEDKVASETEIAEELGQFFNLNMDDIRAKYRDDKLPLFRGVVEGA